MILQEAQTLLSSFSQFTSVGFLFKSWSWELSTWTWQLWVRVLESDIAPQYHFCKVVMWPWSGQSQQRMSSRHIIILYIGQAHYLKHCLTLILMVANFANTKWCKKPQNDWNPCKWVLIWQYSNGAIQWILTWQCWKGFKHLVHFYPMGESSLSIGRVKITSLNPFNAETTLV